MSANISDETLKQFNISREKLMEIREGMLLIKKMEFHEKKIKTGKSSFHIKKKCILCNIETVDIKKHNATKKHRRLSDPASFINDN